MKFSLRTRLAILLLATLAAGGLLLHQLGRYDAQRQAQSDIDRQLDRTAQILLMSWASAHRGPAAIPSVLDSAVVARTARNKAPLPDFEIRTFEPRVLIRSSGFPDLPETPIRDGFADQQAQAVHWRIRTVTDTAHRLVVRVAANQIDIDRRENDLAGRFNRSLLIGLIVIVLAGWLSLVIGLRPLSRLADEVAKRDVKNLAALQSVSPRAATEIRTLASALNHLFRRVGDAIETQRLFTSAAAHELRTPLAGLRTQTDVARRSSDPARQQHALAHIATASQRMNELVNRLLRLARLDAEQYDTQIGHVDVAELARALIADKPLVRLQVETETTVIAGDAELIEVLLTNLITNAECHGPPDSTITVWITRRDQQLQLRVSDAGPGIIASDRDRVFEVFYRGRGARPGSGLGLALVRAIARSHRGDAVLDTDTSDRVFVTVTMPLAEADIRI